MMNLTIRRLLIFIFIGSTLLTLELSSENSLLMSLPFEEDIISAILNQQKADDKKHDAVIQALSNNIDTELDEYNEIMQESAILEDSELLRIQEKASDEAKAEAKRIKNLYTLGDRDKPKDYQNLFDDSIKHTFRIEFTTSEWQGLIDDMNEYNDEFGTYKSNNYRSVNVIYSTPDETITIPDVGYRSKGNIYSRRLPVEGNGDVRPIHFVLKFNETFDTFEGTEAYDWLKTREVFDLENLIFKWNKQNDPTYINELFSYDMFRAAGVAVPEITMAKVEIVIDGQVELTELYAVHEHIDEEFIRKNLQDTPTKEVGDLYKVVWNGTLEPITDSYWYGVRDWENNYRPVYGLETNTDDPNFDDLVSFTTQLNSSNLVMRQQYLEDNFDIDSFLRAMAVNVLVFNPDDYRGNANNYYLYFDEYGYMTYIPFDYDNSMCEGWLGEPVFINCSLGNDIYEWEGDGFSDWTDEQPLIDNLFDYDEYKTLYEDYLMLLIDSEDFSYSNFSAMFDTLESLYGDEFDMVNNKLWYISEKIDQVTEQVTFYRNN
ncbi:CotH kinase family protein [Candidatus Izimaplasma bacterium]|nr:CotH kinase family protein [Candidatus Izimaplasma bacterium]